MQCEDERCRGGGEITTYDSLDHSLGQSRYNGYLAGKMWASHVVLDVMRHSGIQSRELSPPAGEASSVLLPSWAISASPYISSSLLLNSMV